MIILPTSKRVADTTADESLTGLTLTLIVLSPKEEKNNNTTLAFTIITITDLLIICRYYFY
jgi:hypothetical protein